VVLDQQVKDQMTHFAVDYERLGAKTAELHQLVMKMRSHMDGTSAPSYSPRGLGENLSLPPSPMPLF
jgi:hypothetical protein